MSSRIPQDIERQAFDLIVVGAGINGAGIARDARDAGVAGVAPGQRRHLQRDDAVGYASDPRRLALPGVLRVRAGKRVVEG